MDKYTEMLLLMFARDWYAMQAREHAKDHNSELRDMFKERSRICHETFKQVQRDFYNLKE